MNEIGIGEGDSSRNNFVGGVWIFSGTGYLHQNVFLIKEWILSSII